MLEKIFTNDASLKEFHLDTKCESTDAFMEALNTSRETRIAEWVIEVVRLDKKFLNSVTSTEEKVLLLENIGKLPSLKEVHLSNGTLPAKGLRAMLTEARGLKVFHIDRVTIEGGEKDFSLLEIAFEGHSCLQEFSMIEFSTAAAKGKKAAAFKLDNLIKQLGSLKTLDTIKIEASKNSNISFSGLCLGPLFQSTILKEVHLSGLELNPMHFHLISRALSTCPLKVLSLPHTGMNDEGATKISLWLGTSKTLEVLNFSFNKIGDDGCITLANSLTENSTAPIKTVYFTGNKNIGSSGNAALAGLLEKRPSLEFVAPGGDEQQFNKFRQFGRSTRAKPRRSSAMAA